MSEDGTAADTGAFAAQRELSRWVRNPSQPPPQGIEPRRLRIYRRLFFANVEGLLAGNFPVARRLLGDRWTALVDDFFREHPAATPIFPELGREFLGYVESRIGQERGDPAWLPELAHYEWVELALQIDPAEVAPVTALLDGDLLEDIPLPSPVAWPLAYEWPVHRLSPDFQPPHPPPTPTLLLVHRARDGHVRFNELSPLAFRLLQRLTESGDMSGSRHLHALAAEIGVTQVAAFVEEGRAMLERWHRDGVILGVRRRSRRA